MLTVNAEGKVTSQSIKTGGAQGDKWIVSQGLKIGDRVIVEGLQKAKPGATVKASPWKTSALNAANDSATAS